MIKTFEDIMKIAKEKGPKKVAVACAQDEDVLLAIKTASEAGIVNGYLVGKEDEIKTIADKISLDLSTFEIINIEDMAEASLKAVELVSSGQAQLVMKGLVDTAIILKAVLNKEIGLRTGNVLSHVAVFELPKYHKLLTVTDAAMNITPDVNQKKQIIENALAVTRGLEIEKANVGVICAKEKVNPKMQATVDAAELVRMNQEGELTDCVVGGPFALDNAVSKEAAKIKGIKDPIAGDVDIVLTDDIDAGNVLYKALAFLAESRNAGVLVGAKAPVILTSRADSDEAKLFSIALGVLMASKM